MASDESMSRYQHDVMFAHLTSAFEQLLRQSNADPSDARQALDLAIDLYVDSLRKECYERSGLAEVK